jgi:hypothetical protein
MPLTLRVAVGLLWAQFVGLVFLLLYFAVLVIRQTTSLGIYVILFGCALAIAFFVVTRMLHGLRAAGRGGAVALELLLLAPTYYMIVDGFWLGWVLGALIVAVVALLMAPATGRVLRSGAR